jgi:hypothetical protein
MVRTGYSSSRADSGNAVTSIASNMATTSRPSRGRAVVADSAVEETNNNQNYVAADPGLLDRTAYTNASVALHHIEKVVDSDTPSSPPPPTQLG